MIVNGRRRAGRHDEREETERPIFRAIQRVLADAAAHAARSSGLAQLSGSQPSAASSAAKAGRSASTRAAVVAHRRPQARRLVDERANLRHVDEKPEMFVVIVMSEVTHSWRIHTIGELVNWRIGEFGELVNLFWFGQRRFGRPCDDGAIGLEPRSVTRAVPGPLGFIPVDDAAHMRADRRALLEHGLRAHLRSHDVPGGHPELCSPRKPVGLRPLQLKRARRYSKPQPSDP